MNSLQRFIHGVLLLGLLLPHAVSYSQDNHEGLEGAVDRLSHFFIDPVFSPSAIAREKNAVHHEFEDHYENDALKVWRIIKETGSSSHPNAIFSCGNLDSLALVTQQEVKAWHQRYYVPSKMHLVIISAMSLKDLVSLSVKCFGSISSSYCEEKDLTGEILSEKQKGHLVLVEPSYKNRSIQLLWEVPKEYFQDGLCSPVELLELGLDYMGEGSLFDLLTQKELANAVTVDSWQIEKDHLLFLIEISLTKDGVQQYEKVAVQVFRALNKLKEEGIPSYLHDHLYKSKQRLSEYHTPADPFDFAIDTAVTLVDEKLEEYPKAKLSSSLYNEELTKSFLSYLTAEHCAFFLVAPREEFPYKLSMLEKWMKTPYSVRPIPSKQLQAWSSAAPDAEFSIRPYDYEEIDELENPLEDSELLSALECIVDTDALRVRLAVSGDGKEDGSGAFFSIKSPLFTRSLHDAALSSLYLSCFERYMTLTISQSSKNWIIVPHESEAYLIFNFEKSFDYNAVLEFFNALCTHKGSEELFHEIKNEFLDNVPSDPDPLDHAHAALLSLLDSQTFTFIDIYKEIQKVSYDEYAFFVEHLFSNLHFDGVFFGDVSCEKADNLLREIQLCLQSTEPSLENKIPDPTVSDEPFTWNGRYVHHQKTHRKGHALLLALNLGNQSREGWVIQKILSHILQEEFFDELRTKQQTAYR
ncbi:MAG: hypothetical protein EBZ49_09100, partial [Proteobacteria bacterium]|nr:hypothetical protein [Pseudomonadota bacterium]